MREFLMYNKGRDACVYTGDILPEHFKLRPASKSFIKEHQYNEYKAEGFQPIACVEIDKRNIEKSPEDPLAALFNGIAKGYGLVTTLWIDPAYRGLGGGKAILKSDRPQLMLTSNEGQDMVDLRNTFTFMAKCGYVPVTKVVPVVGPGSLFLSTNGAAGKELFLRLIQWNAMQGATGEQWIKGMAHVFRRIYADTPDYLLSGGKMIYDKAFALCV
jgi:GNAT superfamily N-acetyltransferase